MSVCDAPLPIVFDLDGTLIDSVAGISSCINNTLQEFDISIITVDQTRNFVGSGVDALWTRIIAAQQIDPSLKISLLERFMQLYNTSAGDTQLYPQVRESLNLLAERGHPLGLCTNKPTAPTRNVLNKLGLGQHFDAVICGDTLSVRKPDPAPLIATLVKLGANPDAPRGYFVGDSEIDGACAASAEIEFLLYTQGYLHVPIDQIPHVIAFDDFDALAPAIAKLGGH